MDHHSKLVGLVLALLAGGVHAGYANLQPPAGYTSSAGLARNYLAPAANADIWTGSTVRTNAALNVGGQMVKVPVTMRLAANAGRFAAAAAFGWPGLLLTAGIAAYGYFQAEGYEARQDGWYKGRVLPGGMTYTVHGNNVCTNSDLTAAANCALPGYTFGNFTAPGSCGTGAQGNLDAFYNGNVVAHLAVACTGAPAETIYDKLTRQQFEDGLASRPVPENLPQIWPDEVPVNWPVEVPKINPNPLGVPEPLRVPVGDPVLVPLPVPNPDNLPQTWRQPVTDIVPSPTANEPWRVDVQPKDVTSLDPLPMPSPVSVPSPTPEAPGSPTADTPPGLCDQYPDILACAKPRLGEITPDLIPDENRALAITKDTGWGPANGSCPAPRTAVVMGQSISMPMTGICDFATAIRPIIIGMAWLSAALVFFGLSRKD